MAAITKDMQVADVVLRYPDTVGIFFKHGIPAIACGEPIWGTIEENAQKYGVENLEALLQDLNARVSGATGLTVVLESEKKKEEGK